MKCPVCQNLKTQYFLETVNTHGSFRLSEEKFVILRCPLCGVVFPRVVVGKNFYKKYYPRNYYSRSRLTNPILQRTYYLVAKFFLRLQQRRYLKTGRVLDFGCGRGDFLASLSPATEKYGVEINQQAVKFIKEKYPEIKIFRDWEKLRSRRIKFDLITLWHVLEHLEKPKKILQQLVGRLKKDGHLIIATPNTGSWGFRWARSHWFHLDTPRHLAIFNVSGLVDFCRQAGMELVAIKGGVIEYPLDLFWSIYNRYKTKHFFLNFPLGLFSLSASLIVKLVYLFKLGKSEIITVACKKK